MIKMHLKHSPKWCMMVGNDKPWREQNIKHFGYHYYMTPEAAQIGLDKLPEAVKRVPRIWTDLDYPDLRNMDVFK